MYQEYGYLIHSKGPWKDHKYKKKVKVNGVWKYTYTDKIENSDVFEDHRGSTYREDDQGVRLHDKSYHRNKEGKEVRYDPTEGSRNIVNSIDKITKSASGLRTAKQLADAKLVNSRTKELSDEQVRKQRAARTKNLSDEQVRKQKETNDALARERRTNIVKNAYDDQKRKKRR